MRIAAMLLTLGVLALAVQAREPDDVWHFDTEPVVSEGASKRKFHRAQLAPQVGFGGTSGLLCGPEYRNYAAYFSGLEHEQVTLELKFKRTGELDARRPATLLSYAVNSYYRRQFTLRIEPDGRLTAWFEMRDDADAKKVLNSFQLSGDSLTLETGRWYTLRLTSQAGGPLRLWLDQRLYAAADQAPGFSDLAGYTPKEYPMLGLGYNLYAATAQVHHPFPGVLDDLKIWSSIQDPSPLDGIDQASEGSSLYPNLLVASDGSWREWTRPLTVYDRETAVLGAFEKAEGKFHEHAARAALSLRDDQLRVRFHCPVPVDVSLEPHSSVAWRGDCVEFFFRPSDESEVYYQYVVNASGLMQAFYYRGEGNRQTPWTTAARAEVKHTDQGYEVNLAIPLEELGLTAEQVQEACLRSSGNFTRSGPTAGGQSSWAPVGANFHNTMAFGRLVFGGRKAYFQQELSGRIERLNGFSPSALRDRASQQAEQLREAIEEHGEQPAAWDRLSDALYNFDLTLVQLALSGREHLIEEKPVWDNVLTLSSTARPVESIELEVARHDRLLHGLTFTNLTDQPFLGQLKFVPTLEHIGRFNRQDDHPLYGRLRLLESVPVPDRNGQPSYDPLAPLPMGTLLRAAPGASVPLWLEVDTGDLPAGTYAGYLYLKSAHADFPDEAVPFRLRVAEVDLSSVQVDSFNYHYLPPEMYKLIARDEQNYLYAGTPGQRALDIYPTFDAEGNILQTHFEVLDQKIQAHLRAGIPADQFKIILFLGIDLGWVTMREGKRQFESWTPQWEKAFHAFLHALLAHLQERYGFSDDRLVLYPVDEPSGDVDTPGTQTYQAWRFGQIVRAAGTGARLMVNPTIRQDALSARNLTKLAEVYDILELYRGHTTPTTMDWARQTGREIWTYHILQRTNAPSLYRRMAWQNLRDGFTGVVAYWHMDAMAGGDGFNAHDTYPGRTNTADYGTLYVDFNLGTHLTSRRQEAWYRGFLDYKLATLCQSLLEQGRGTEADRTQLDQIIATGAEADMRSMDHLRLDLLQLAEKLSRR